MGGGGICFQFLKILIIYFFRFLFFMFSPILGYTPAIKGQLLHVDATTSMQYRTLLEAEMLAVSLTYMMICIYL